jgi:mannosyltransferase OCH1-like enzyme
MIPKKLHFVWVGDESKMPTKCVQTWIDKNTEYEVKIWGNQEAYDNRWINKSKMTDMFNKKDYAGVSDIMRYEILYEHGGVYVDVDSYCINPLEDWLLGCEAFACWEQEIVRNNLIANGCIGGIPKAGVWKMCIDAISKIDCKVSEKAWKITGPQLLSDLFFKKRANLTVYPSHFFLPEHLTGHISNVTGHRFASHMWGSVNGYNQMDEKMEKKQ